MDVEAFIKFAPPESAIYRSVSGHNWSSLDNKLADLWDITVKQIQMKPGHKHPKYPRPKQLTDAAKSANENVAGQFTGTLMTEEQTMARLRKHNSIPLSEAEQAAKAISNPTPAMPKPTPSSTRVVTTDGISRLIPKD